MTEEVIDIIQDTPQEIKTNIQIPSFDDIIKTYAKPLIGLQGKSYDSIIKMVTYSVLGDQFKYNSFWFGNKYIDLRIPLIAMMKAGYGKKDLEYFIKRTIEESGKLYEEPSTYHPEQFIGKVIEATRDGDDDKEIPGYFSSDYIVIDEAKDLLSSKDPKYLETLKNIRTALDPIGYNQVRKGGVNIVRENRLKLFPTCTLTLLTQLLTDVNESLLTNGNLRRFLIIKVDGDKIERQKARQDIQTFDDFGNNELQILWNNWKELNLQLKNRGKVKFYSDNSPEIDFYIDNLIKSMEKDDSFEGMEFIDSVQFNIKMFILKMACIRALLEQPNEVNVKVTSQNIIAAIQDYDELWSSLIIWIKQKLVLKDEKPKGWKDDQHGWIIKNLKEIKAEAISQQDLTKDYIEENKGFKADSTLKKYMVEAIKDLTKWEMIEQNSKEGAKGNYKVIRLKKTEKS